VDPRLLPRVSTHVGGATRILIIDDDVKSVQPVPPNNEAGHDQVERLDRPGASHAEGRPVIHEFQLATPLPSDPVDSHSSSSEFISAGPRDASVVRELIARVEELLHQTRGLPAGATTGLAGTIRFGSVLLEPATQTVLRGGQPVRVTNTEFRLLLALMRRRGAIASRVELLREVWGAGAAVSRRAVDTHIARLRRKLEDDSANPRHILTALAWGYRFRP
jgi:two-component system KDP operon response regulator KdpE